MANELSIIIPVYNEEAILEAEVNRLMFEMQEKFRELDYEVVLVENGSFDRTREIVQELIEKYENVRGVYLPKAGYGQALKQGLLETDSTYTALFNIDFWDVPFLKKALTMIKEKNLSIIVGSKTAPGAEDTRPLVRRVITRAFNAILRFVFGFYGTDTHGMKLIRTAVMKPVVAACRTEKEIFDTEFVLRAQAAGLTSEEIPVVCVERRKTTYNISKRIPRTIRDLITLFFTFRLRQFHHGRLALGVGAIIFFLGAAFYGFPDSPSPWFDNGVNLGLAKTYVQDGVYSLRLSGHDLVDRKDGTNKTNSTNMYIKERSLFISTNYPLIGWIIFSFWLFGIGLWQAQVVMIMFMVAFLIVAGLLVRQWYGSRYVPWTLALIATFLPFYGNGLSGGLGEVAGLVYFLGGLLCVGVGRTNSWRLVVGGLLFGLAASTKVIYILLLPAVGVAELYIALKARRVLWQRWCWLGLGIALPLLLWLRTLLPEGLTLAGVRDALAYYVNPYDVQGVVGENLLRFVRESTPAHFAMMLAVLVIGVVGRTYRADRNDKTYGEMAVLVFAVLNVWFYVRTAGWYRYFFPAHLLVLALAAGVAGGLVEMVVGRIGPIIRIRQIFVPVALGALVLVQGVHLVRGRGDGLYYNPLPRQFAAELDGRFGKAGVMVFDKPEMWFFLKNPNTRQYMQMNPRVAFGEDVFATRNLPEYIVGGEPGENYLGRHATELSRAYERVEERGEYVVWRRK